MANYYIGTLYEGSLSYYGFTKFINEGKYISLRNSFIEAYKIIKGGGIYNCIAFQQKDENSNRENNKNSKLTLDSIGKCKIGIIMMNPNDGSSGNYDSYKIYFIERCQNDANTDINETCIKNNSISALNILIPNEEKILKWMETRKIAINDNIDDSVASTRVAIKDTTASTRVAIKDTTASTRVANSSQDQNNDKIAQYEDLLTSIRLSHKNSKQLLSDKNRLIASTSSNIQTSTDKLEDLNNKINEANQEIAKNNSDFEKKNNIITTLRAMITIFFILLLIMIVYYGALYTRDVYPETYNSISNTINNSFSSFSSFNTNY